MKENKMPEHGPGKNPKPFSLQSAKNSIDFINSTYRNPVQRLRALQNLLLRVPKGKTDPKAYTSIEDARARESGNIAELKTRLKEKLHFKNDPNGIELGKINAGFWKAVEKGNGVGATSYILAASSFARKNCRKDGSEYLETLARGILNNFVEGKIKLQEPLPQTLFSLCVEKATELVKGVGTEDDISRLRDLQSHGNQIFESGEWG